MSPWSVVEVAGSLLVSQRDTGEIVEVAGETVRVAGVVEDTVHGGESGLLGLAVDDQQRLYAYSTGPSGNRVQRFAVGGVAGSLTLGAPETVVSGIPAGRVHDGGRLGFGPDGMLYITTGDAGDRDAAQDPASLGGKILRVTPDGDVPADNPIAGSPVYSKGHRNPQGIAWDSDGRMFAAEFGQDTWDELNIIEPGADYGWPAVEGVAGDARFIDPVQQWSPAEASPSGIAIAAGSVYLANLRGEVLRAVPLSDPARSAALFAGELGRIRDVVAGSDGSLLILTSNTDGRGDPSEDDDRLLRIELSTPVP